MAENVTPLRRIPKAPLLHKSTQTLPQSNSEHNMSAEKSCVFGSSDDFNCTMSDTLKCPGAYCIGVQHRCDGTMDCPNGEDEANCNDYTCPGYYRCRGQLFCIPLDKVCDGLKQCPQGDDEMFCGK